jgi:hypothetical protein
MRVEEIIIIAVAATAPDPLSEAMGFKVVATQEFLPTNLPTEKGSYSPFQRPGLTSLAVGIIFSLEAEETAFPSTGAST